MYQPHAIATCQGSHRFNTVTDQVAWELVFTWGQLKPVQLYTYIYGETQLCLRSN